jgi:2,5-dioxopentanoate dehydrogenase
LFATDAQNFMADERLGHEVFGSSPLVVRCPVIDTLVPLSERLEGQLTATLHMEPVAKIWSGAKPRGAVR